MTCQGTSRVILRLLQTSLLFERVYLQSVHALTHSLPRPSDINACESENPTKDGIYDGGNLSKWCAFSRASLGTQLSYLGHQVYDDDDEQRLLRSNFKTQEPGNPRLKIPEALVFIHSDAVRT